MGKLLKPKPSYCMACFLQHVDKFCFQVMLSDYVIHMLEFVSELASVVKV